MIHPERCISMKTSQAIRLPQVSITENVLKCNNFFAFWHILHTSLLRFSLIPVFYPQQLLCLCFCHLLRRHKFLISEHKTEMPYSRSHACLPCDLLCAHIAALRSKKSVSIPPCGKCSVNLSRLRYRLLTAWHFCFPGLFTNAKCGCWQYMQEKYLTTYDLLKRKYALQQPCHCCKALEFLIFIYGSIDYLIILHIIACII